MSKAPPTERDVEIAARLQAQGFMLANVFRLVYSALRLSEDEIRQFHLGILEQVSRETFREYDPALSDHYADLVQDAIASLVKAVEALPPDAGLSMVRKT